MRLNFFLDIDGTIVPFGKAIPKSTVDAIQKAKSEGHRVFLGTGRAPFEVHKEILGMPINGGVYSSGAILEVDGKQIFRRVADEAQRKLFFDVAERYKLLWLIQGREKSFITRRAFEFHKELSIAINGRPVELFNLEFVERFPDDEPISKFFIMSESGMVLEARKELEGPFDCVNNTTGFPEENAAEVMLPGLSKSSGIRRMMEYLGDGMESTVGIGDGENDLDMVKTCAMGIAMGNSCEILKKHADFVTDHVDNDGLAKAIYYAMKSLK